MNIERFREAVQAAIVENPQLLLTPEVIGELGLQESDFSDPPVTEAEIIQAEQDLGVKFPKEYILLLKECGGGIFGSNEIYSVRSGSRRDIRLNQNDSVQANGFLAVSPNGCGDYYGFRVADGVCESVVSFSDHEQDGEVSATEYQNILDYIAASLRL